MHFFNNNNLTRRLSFSAVQRYEERIIEFIDKRPKLCFLIVTCLLGFMFNWLLRFNIYDKQVTFVVRNLADRNSHKDLFPLDSSDYIGTVFVVLGLIIAASGGIGGGGILVPLFILVFHFTPMKAIPLSNFTIFGGSITNVILNVQKRHPDVDRPLVDWSLITVMQPLTLAGAIMGAYIGRLIEEWMLILALVFLLSYTAYRTLSKGVEQFRKESASRTESAKGLLVKIIEEDEEDAESQSLLAVSDEEKASKDKISERTVLPEGPSSAADDIQFDENEENSDNKNRFLPSGMSQEDTPIIQLNMTAEREKIVAAERKTPAKKVQWVVLMFVGVTVLNILSGERTVECGSLAFWAINVANVLWILAVSFVMRRQLISEWERKRAIKYRYQEGDVEWTPYNTVVYPVLCILAGLCAGMFGIGGGLVFGPMMLEMGVHPMVASATSAVMIFFTSITASTTFIAFGTLTYDYAIYLFVLGLVATAAGQLGVGYLVQKYKRFSIISLSIGVAVAISAVLMGVQGAVSIAQSDGSYSNNKICGSVGSGD